MLDGRWQLKHKGRVVAEHTTEYACVIEAFERGYVVRIGMDAHPDIRGKRVLSRDVSIEKVS